MENEKNNQDKRKYDILQEEATALFFKNRKTQFLFQLPAVLFFVLVVLAGFFGIQNSNKSLTTISIWVIWWSLLLISLALLGRVWCFMCPFGAIGDWVQHRTFYKRVNDIFSLNRKFPVKFRNLSLAAMLFLVTHGLISSSIL
jgi:polyferredoxin